MHLGEIGVIGLDPLPRQQPHDNPESPLWCLLIPGAHYLKVRTVSVFCAWESHLCSIQHQPGPQFLLHFAQEIQTILNVVHLAKDSYITWKLSWLLIITRALSIFPPSLIITTLALLEVPKTLHFSLVPVPNTQIQQNARQWERLHPFQKEAETIGCKFLFLCYICLWFTFTSPWAAFPTSSTFSPLIWLLQPIKYVDQWDSLLYSLKQQRISWGKKKNLKKSLINRNVWMAYKGISASKKFFFKKSKINVLTQNIVIKSNI